MKYSKISVITPSFNQGRFIEQTILSVLGQQYPNLEYIIIDGGSTDNTLDVIKKYEQHITYWVSEKDNGQSDAINKGFRRATGELMCWLNSDDYYLPGALLEVNNKLNPQKKAILFGNCIHLNEEKNLVTGSYFDPFGRYDIMEGTFINQPSSFFTRQAFELAGELRTDLHYCFDWEWFARAQQMGVDFIPDAAFLSVYRIHNAQKSDSNNIRRFLELTAVDRQLNPAKYRQIDGYLDRNADVINFIYNTADRLSIPFIEYRTLNMLFPKLISRIDKHSLKKYIRHFYKKTNKEVL
jgi:glycosyltransferase involved in cell wall biosynthesis